MPTFPKPAPTTLLDEFAAHCLELFSPLGMPHAKKMFGGHGLYVDDVCIALILNEQLYLKADALTCQAFEVALGQPFVYQAKGRDVRVNFWTPPPEALESPALMLPWARLAMEAALRTRLNKSSRKAPRSTTDRTKATAIKRRSKAVPKSPPDA
jgi:DNA transformation protein and related proteins